MRCLELVCFGPTVTYLVVQQLFLFTQQLLDLIGFDPFAHQLEVGVVFFTELLEEAEVLVLHVFEGLARDLEKEKKMEGNKENNGGKRKERNNGEKKKGKKGGKREKITRGEKKKKFVLICML